MRFLSAFAVVALFIMVLVCMCLEDWTGANIFLAAELIVVGLSE